MRLLWTAWRLDRAWCCGSICTHLGRRTRSSRGAATLRFRTAVLARGTAPRGVCHAGGRRAQVARPEEDGLYATAAEVGAAEGQRAVGRTGHRGLPDRRPGLDRGVLH